MGTAAEAQEPRHIMQHLTNPSNHLGLPPTPWLHSPSAAGGAVIASLLSPLLASVIIPLLIFLSCYSET